MVVVKASFNELLWNLPLAIAWHIVGPLPMVIIIFTKCALLIYLSPRYFKNVILRHFFNSPYHQVSKSYSRIFLLSTCFSVILSGEALNKCCNIGGRVLWRRKQQPPPFLHYFHQKGRQIRWQSRHWQQKQLSGTWVAGWLCHVNFCGSSGSEFKFSHIIRIFILSLIYTSPCWSKASSRCKSTYVHTWKWVPY